jgi:hypothetical protein
MSLPYYLRLVAAAIPALVLSAHAAVAQEWPKSFACTFDQGLARSYDKGRYKRTVAKPLKMQITAIDLDAQSAELTSAEGKNKLRIVRALGANHFLEVVAEGYLNTTTVYARDQKRGAYPAVHSRHFGIFGEPLVAQYTGACQPN